MLTGQILLELIAILCVVQILGALATWVGQLWVIGEVVAGIALGPSLLGALAPGVESQLFPAGTLPTLDTLGQIGLVLYMFSMGAHMDASAMLLQRRKVLAVSLSGIALPFALGVTLALPLYPRFAGSRASQISFVLVVGVSMAITAFPVLARLLAEKQLTTSRIGVLALTSAAVGDVIAWCLLATVVAVIHADNLGAAVATECLTLVFVAAMLTVVRPILAYVAERAGSQRALVALSLICLLASAYSTNALGIHPVFGAFLMGMILPRQAPFVDFIESIDQVNTGLFLPLYFVYSGLQTHIGLVHDPSLWLLCLLLVAAACAGKFVGCAGPLRLAGDNWHAACTLGILMNTRGLVELIVLNIGLELGVLSPTLFAMLVIMALATTAMTSPLLTLVDRTVKRH
jgi:Kef-type K+ transport system membrane component KefB